MADCPQLTTGAGNSIADNQNFITAGPMGPAS
jgi:catalase